MTLRAESTVGFLMLQWLGVLVPGAFRGALAVHQGRRAGMSDAATSGANLTVTSVYPGRGTVQMSATPAPDWKRCHCSRLVPPNEWVEPHGCCDDCYWRHPDSREERFALQCDDDRDRLVDEVRD